MDIPIREVLPDEWRELRDLRIAALASDADAFGSTLANALARPEEGWRTYADGGHGTVTYVAVRDGRFIGMARGRVEGTEGGLYGMWVAPEARRRGVGRRLVEAVLAWSRARGLVRVVLGAAEARLPARALYRRCGFVETGRRLPMDNHPGTCDVEMEWSPSPSKAPPIPPPPPTSLTRAPPMDPTTRFSNRVDDYARWRPGYPREILRTLEAGGALPASGAVVDLGSGTGLLSRVFLEAGHAVVGIEPNGPMRAAGDRELASFPRFTGRDGTAEATGLPHACADLVSAGQAFHWFDPERTRVEARRILRPGGAVALVWNDRDLTSPFLAEYEALLRTLPAYESVRHRLGEDDRASGWFGSPRTASFPNSQTLDWIGLRGRFLSSSYAPKEGEPGFAAVEEDLRRLFESHARDGTVELRYVTRLFWGAP